MRRMFVIVLTACLCVLAGCGGNSDPLRGMGGPGSSDPNTIVVGSANFPESETIAEIYAAALRANHFTVQTRLDIGSREAYIPAVRGGSIDLVPDYTGNLLQYLDSSVAATGAGDIDAALRTALGPGLALGTPAPAEDKDAVVVTQNTADRWHLTSIADLAAHSAEVRFAAQAEFAERREGLPGLKKTYGLDISTRNFVPIADGGGPATVAALVSGQITAADIFTTSPAIGKHHLVVLTDPAHNFAAQNVVPVINAHKRSDRLLAVLNAVDADLTTADLVALNDAVSGDSKTEPDVAATRWLTAHGLDKPIG